MILVDEVYTILAINIAAKNLFKVESVRDKSIKFTDLFDSEQKHEVRQFQSGLDEGCESEVRLTLNAHISDFTRVEIIGVANVQKGIHLLNVRDITEREAEYRRRERFVAVAGHELKTPVAVIKAYSQLLIKRLQNTITEKPLNYLQKIENKSDLLTKLIDELVEEIKAGSGTIEYEDSLFRLDELIDSTVTELNKVSKTHTIKIVNLVKVSIEADKTRIMQIVNNLLSNAMKYSPQSDKVIVTLEKKGICAILSVQDFGRGIPKKDHKAVFQPFYRSRSQGKKKYTGLGLGLFIARNIARHYQGRLHFKSEYGHGSTFYLELPIVEK